jgi:phosphoglycolate phosphatase
LRLFTTLHLPDAGQGASDPAMSEPIVVFDLDGTLIDTAPDLIDALNFILARVGLPVLPYAEARTMIGGGAKAMLARALAADGADPSSPALDRLFRDFIDHYSAHIADRSRPFPGLEAVLDRLAADNHRLAVCTNKLELLSVKLLNTLGLADRFSAICGQDTFGVQKPDPIILRKTIAAAGGQIDAAIMIGDSEIDVRTAQAAGVPVIAVDFGYTPRPVVEFNPDRVISHFNDLPGVIAEFTARK